MKLEKIITLGNDRVRIRLLAMERSLRAVGCDLPLLVIPYDDNLFDLPPNATWWRTDIRDWLIQEKAHPMMYKYQCLSTANYQFVDGDVIFLKDPAKALAEQEGFITCCGHWHDTNDTCTDESMAILKAMTTCWQRNVFNAGQFACDRVLYTDAQLRATCLDPRYIETCLRFPFHDQPGLNLLANLSGVPIRNLTLSATGLESSWAGDYHEGHHDKYWADEARKPYLIHWAGCDIWNPRTVDTLFTNYLNEAELAEWNEEVAARKAGDVQYRGSLLTKLRGVAKGVKVIAKEVSK